MGQYASGYLTITTGSGLNIQLSNVDFPTEAEVTGDGSGSLYENTLSLTKFAPNVSYTTKHLKAILDSIALGSSCIGSAFVIKSVDVYSRALKTCKAVLPDGAAMKWSISDGLARIGSVAGSRTEDATISGLIDAFTDGTNAPVVETVGATLPTPMSSARYRLGLCGINGIEFPDIEGIALDYAVSITDKSPAFGSVWPESAGVDTVRPVLVLSGRDLSKVQAGLIELGANPVTHVDSLLQFIKLKDAGSFEDFTSPVHISMTIDGLAVPEMLVSSSGTGNATNSIRIPLKSDGTNAPIVTNTDSVYKESPLFP